MWSRFDAEAAREANIYPDIWDDGDDSDRDYFTSYYDELRAFFATAAERNEAMIIYLN